MEFVEEFGFILFGGCVVISFKVAHGGECHVNAFIFLFLRDWLRERDGDSDAVAFLMNGF